MDVLPRICVPEGVQPGALTLQEAQARHLAARRLRRGDEFLVFTGKGREYRARLEELSRGGATATVGEIARQAPPPARSVEVWCAHVRASRMAWAIEKCTEAGAGVFRPITTERSARGDAVSEERYERWRRIAIEAAEQCGRLYLPMIAPVTAFSTALETLRGPLILADQQGDSWREAASRLPGRGALAVAVGPEGGFTEAETALATEAGALVASFGPNTLRTETAAVVAVAALASA